MSEGIWEHGREILVRPSPFEFLTSIAVACDKDPARSGIGMTIRRRRLTAQRV
jgi:hypothetical protein